MSKPIAAPKLPTDSKGAFVRPASTFTGTIQKGGRFEPERDRYHLYVALVCSFANRTLIARNLKGLQDIIPVTVVSSLQDADGWVFDDKNPAFPGAQLDPLYGCGHIKDLYLKADPNFSGRSTVPVLWDKKLGTIVNNESSQIIRIFNTAFNDILPQKYAEVDLYPQELRTKIDEVNEWVYKNINNGIYRSGFSTSQNAYEEAVVPLFNHLDRVETILAAGSKKYLVGDRLTEADIRLFVSMIRFDVAYHGHFKCNISTIRHGYPEINRWMKNLYWNEAGFKETINFQHIKAGYYSNANINPTGVVPVGPVPDVEPLDQSFGAAPPIIGSLSLLRDLGWLPLGGVITVSLWAVAKRAKGVL